MPIDMQWHHLAASYDGTTIKWYGDGMLIGSNDTVVLNTPDNVHIGKREDNTNFFPGMVDDFRIYNRVLSDAEMAGLGGMTKPFDKPF
jgi:sialidase-1